MGWGDEVMASGRVKLVPDRKVVRILDRFGNPRRHEAWVGNPRIAMHGERFHVELTDGPKARPYIVSLNDAQFIWREYAPEPGELFLTDMERSFAAHGKGKVVIHIDLKHRATPNKAWGLDRWRELVNAHPEVPWLQIVQPGGPLIDKKLPYIVTPSMRCAAAIIGAAKAAVLQEGGLHHIAAAMGTRAVVIFGGFISPAVTGYSFHRNLFLPSKKYPLGCGMRQACPHCRDAMNLILAHDVFHELKRVTA